MVDASHPYTMQIQCTSSGHTYDLMPAALAWQSEDESVAMVSEQGVISAAGEGYTHVIGAVDDFRDTILVHVVAPVPGKRCWDNLLAPSSWELTATTNFNPEWQNGSIVFTYAGGRGSYVRFAGDSAILAIPDTIRIPINASADVQKVTIGIRPDNAVAAKILTLYENGLPTAADVNMDIPVSEMLGSDPAIHPLHFESVKFFIATSTPKQQHTLAMQGIWLLAPDVQDALPATPPAPASGVQKRLTPDGLVIIKDDNTYSVLGTPIK
jgi:hypothetical protein